MSTKKRDGNQACSQCFLTEGMTYQDVRERPKESPGGLWQFIGLMSLCHPPRHDSADTVQRGFEYWGKCENDYRGKLPKVLKVNWSFQTSLYAIGCRFSKDVSVLRSERSG